MPFLGLDPFQNIFLASKEIRHRIIILQIRKASNFLFMLITKRK